MLARDVMKRDVVTVNTETTIKEVAKLLLEHNISGMPVVDAVGRVLGIVSEGDLIYQDKKLHTPAFMEILGGVIYLENPQRMGQEIKKMTAAKVAEIMTEKVYTVKEDAPVQDIATLMVEKRINRVPVVDKEGKLVGLVSRHDLIKYLT